MSKEKDPAKILALRPVVKLPIEEVIPGFKTNPGHSHAIVVNHGKKDQKIVNFCSADYQLVPNDVIYENFKAALREAGYRFSTSFSSRNDCQFKLDFKILDNRKKVLERDMLIPTASLKNSYDGKIKFGSRVGFHRVICSNGLTVADGKETKIDAMHMPNLYTAKGYDKIIGSFEGFLQNSKEMLKPYKELAKRKLKKSQVEERIMSVIEATDFPKRQAEAAIARALEEHKIYKLELSDWLVYNAMNFQLNHNPNVDLDINRFQAVDSQVLNFLSNNERP